MDTTNTTNQGDTARVSTTGVFNTDALLVELRRRRLTFRAFGEMCGLSASYVGLIAGGLRPSRAAQETILVALATLGVERDRIMR